jgi:hypothetical protein
MHLRRVEMRRGTDDPEVRVRFLRYLELGDEIALEHICARLATSHDFVCVRESEREKVLS